MKTLCQTEGHHFITTTQGTLNKCAYCKHRKEFFNFGTYQVNGEYLTNAIVK